MTQCIRCIAIFDIHVYTYVTFSLKWTRSNLGNFLNGEKYQYTYCGWIWMECFPSWRLMAKRLKCSEMWDQTNKQKWIHFNMVADWSNWTVSFTIFRIHSHTQTHADIQRQTFEQKIVKKSLTISPVVQFVLWPVVSEFRTEMGMHSCLTGRVPMQVCVNKLIFIHHYVTANYCLCDVYGFGIWTINWPENILFPIIYLVSHSPHPSHNSR